MSNILNFISENWEYFVAAGAIVAIFVQMGRNGISKAISSAMLFAEKKANEALEKKSYITGEQKREFVIDFIYGKIPAFLRGFITRGYVGKKIENIIDDLKDLADDGQLNNSIKLLEDHTDEIS